MSVIDKILGAITPPESEEARAEARAKSRALAGEGDWLALALDHHDQIRDAFAACLSTSGPVGRTAAMKKLALVLNGHSLAEEVVLYPALAKGGEKGHASLAYTEQTTAKMQMAELERIDPADEAWADKLEHIQGAVLHHIFEEEGAWFPELKSQYDYQEFLTRRFREEFERYVGDKTSTERRAPETRTFGEATTPPSLTL